MKRTYMVMQDVNYQLFAESVEAECTFGLKHPGRSLAEKRWKNWGLLRSGSAIPTRSPAVRSSGWRRLPWSV